MAWKLRRFRSTVHRLKGVPTDLWIGLWMPRISEIALFTVDVPRLADFYEGLLARPADARSDRHASFDIGGGTLFIHVPGGPVGGPPKPRPRCVRARPGRGSRAGTGRRCRCRRSTRLLLGPLCLPPRPRRARDRASARDVTQPLAQLRVGGDELLQLRPRDRDTAHVRL